MVMEFLDIVRYYNRTLSKHENKYDNTDLEPIGVVCNASITELISGSPLRSLP